MADNLNSLLWMAYTAGLVKGDLENVGMSSSQTISEWYKEWQDRDYVQRSIREFEEIPKEQRVQESMGNVSRSGMDLNSLCYSIARWLDLAEAEGVNRGLLHVDTMREIYEELSRLRDLEH